MPNLRLVILVFLTLSICCAAGRGKVYAWSSLGGTADLSYAEWEREVGGAQVADASHFTQSYSLVYQVKNGINHGRGGQYDLSLGYDWTSVDSDVNLNGTTTSFDFSDGKLLYGGDLRFEPGGLPFRIHAYARDMNRPSYGGESLGFGNEFEDFDPGIVTDLADGTRFETGVTLVAGIRNGSYLGKYRDMLSNFPRIFIDYRQVDLEDLNSRTPQKYRERNLAFVSLNKKDNWFHYRFYDYKDFLDPDQDFYESTIMLGTVDHRLQRHWVNMTNWIQVSADLSFTDLTRQSATVGRQEERFDINLFTKARRSNWNLVNFTNYQRLKEVNQLRKDLEIPVYAKGDLDRNTSWRFNFIGHADQALTSTSDTGATGAYLSSRLDMFRQSRYILAPIMALEYNDDDIEGEAYAANAGFEYFSNQAFNPRHALFGRAAVTYIDSQNPASNPNEERDYWETELTGKVESRWNTKFLSGVEQTFLFGVGEIFDVATRYVRAKADIRQIEGELSGFDIQGETFRSISTLYGEWAFTARSEYRLQFKADYLSTATQSAAQFIISDRLSIYKRDWTLRIQDELILGDDLMGRVINAGTPTGPIGQASLPTGVIDFQFSHSGSLDYSTSNNWSFRLDEHAGYVGAANGDVINYGLRQQYKYNIYKVNGVVRRLAQLTQEFDLEGIHQEGGEDESLFSLAVQGDYYPTRRTLLAGKVRYRYFIDTEQSEWSYVLAAGLHFEKLRLDAEYAYGDREGSDTALAVMEHRWEVKLSKIF